MDLAKLANEALKAAKTRRLRIATAESCSAGRLASFLSEGDGASHYFAGGVVAYTKEMKARALDVPSSLLSERGAVCAEVATAMAQGLLARYPAEIGVAITGVGGPEPDEDGNPVGEIHVAVAQQNGCNQLIHLSLGYNEKSAIVNAAMETALHAVLRTLAMTGHSGKKIDGVAISRACGRFELEADGLVRWDESEAQSG